MSDSTRRFDLAIEALRARVEEEFRITERLDTKSRQAFALAAGLFAVAQALAFGSFAETEVTSTDRLAILIVALIAATLLGVTAHRVADAEDLQPEKDIDPGHIEAWARDENDEAFAQEMIVHLRAVADRRAENNDTRAARYARVLFFVRWTLILTGVEALLALALRI